ARAKSRPRWSSTTSTWNLPCAPCTRPLAWTRRRQKKPDRRRGLRPPHLLRAGKSVLESQILRRRAREAEGAPLLREYVAKNCIVGSNPTVSARSKKKPLKNQGLFCLPRAQRQVAYRRLQSSRHHCRDRCKSWFGHGAQGCCLMSRPNIRFC